MPCKIQGPCWRIKTWLPPKVAHSSFIHVVTPSFCALELESKWKTMANSTKANDFRYVRVRFLTKKPGYLPEMAKSCSCFRKSFTFLHKSPPMSSNFIFSHEFWIFLCVFQGVAICNVHFPYSNFRGISDITWLGWQSWWLSWKMAQQRWAKVQQTSVKQAETVWVWAWSLFVLPDTSWVCTCTYWASGLFLWSEAVSGCLALWWERSLAEVCSCYLDTSKQPCWQRGVLVPSGLERSQLTVSRHAPSETSVFTLLCSKVYLLVASSLKFVSSIHLMKAWTTAKPNPSPVVQNWMALGQQQVQTILLSVLFWVLTTASFA